MAELNQPECRLAYTVKQVCELTNMGRNKFYEVARAGKLKVRKDGKINLVRPASRSRASPPRASACGSASTHRQRDVSAFYYVAQ